MDVLHMLRCRRESGYAGSRSSFDSIVSDAGYNHGTTKPHLACAALPGISLQRWLRDPYPPPYISAQGVHTRSVFDSLEEQFARLETEGRLPAAHCTLPIPSEQKVFSGQCGGSLLGIGAVFDSPLSFLAQPSAQDGRHTASIGSSTPAHALPEFSLPPPVSNITSPFGGDGFILSSRGGGEASTQSAGRSAGQPQAGKKRTTSQRADTRRSGSENQSKRNSGSKASLLVKGGFRMHFAVNTRLACPKYKFDPEAHQQCAQEHFVSAAAMIEHLQHSHGSELGETVIAAILRLNQATSRQQLPSDSMLTDKRIWQMALCTIVPQMLPICERLQPDVGQPLLQPYGPQAVHEDKEDKDYRSVLLQLYRVVHQNDVQTEPASAQRDALPQVVRRSSGSRGRQPKQISPNLHTASSVTEPGAATSCERSQTPAMPAVVSDTRLPGFLDDETRQHARAYHGFLCAQQVSSEAMLRCLEQEVTIDEAQNSERDQQVAALRLRIKTLADLAKHYTCLSGLDATPTRQFITHNTPNEGAVRPESAPLLLPESPRRPNPVTWLAPITPNRRQTVQHPSASRALSPPGLTEASDTASLSSHLSQRTIKAIERPATPNQREPQTPTSSADKAELDPKLLEKDKQQRDGDLAVTPGLDDPAFSELFDQSMDWT